MHSAAPCCGSLKNEETTAACGDGDLGWELDELVGSVQTGRTRADFRFEGQREERLRIFPTPFMCSVLHFRLHLLVSIKHRRPGFPFAQRARTGPGLWFSLLFTPLAGDTLGRSGIFSSICVAEAASRCSQWTRSHLASGLCPSLGECAHSASLQGVHLQASLHITLTRTNQGRESHWLSFF